MKFLSVYKQFLIFFIITILLSGCAQKRDYEYTGSNTQTGAIIGGILGALIGASTKGNSKAKRALIGGVIGASVGGAIGYSIEKQAEDVAKELDTKVDNSSDAIKNENKDLIVSNTDKYVKITLKESMVFATDSAYPTNEASQRINKISKVLRNYPNTTVQVVGFTDNRGSYLYNLKLSKKRALNVGQVLYESGITNEVFSKGCSYEKPIVPNDSLENMALNRRVEIYLYQDVNKIVDPCKNY
ncbi:OmpA family protein [Halarcobacter sp.]|uniref:OmpA family protein n=1 Tax=Halarcobacter sp. TaxID=2321133 RepID=UPI002AA714A5|nr:OmpA family protein [Halarcobacter sp.]